ncbi:MAG TPA: GNAT family protein [Herpetosiphonaceae bacterium]|nr:GNAT family protein [Herpetosiphonaceae bacterium]
MTEIPLVNFTSARLAYGPLSNGHQTLSLKWANDFSVSGPRAMVLRPYAPETIAAWGERTRTGPDRTVFALYERATNRLIGETGFTSVDFFHRTAEFGILIGETDCWGQGYGGEATRRMLAYGFTQLRLHTIWLQVSSANERAIRAYERAGFQHAGRRREAQWINDTLCDIVYMECLASEFHGQGG